MLRIAIIGTVGVPASYGGFETLIENLLDFNTKNFQYTVFCSSKSYTDRPNEYKNARLEYLSLKANGISSIFYDGLSLYKCLKAQYDIILILGVSGAIFLPFIKPLLKSKLLCNIDGIEWKRNKWNIFTKTFLKVSELLAVKFSDIIITDNQGISEYVKLRYQIKSTTIAYGAEPEYNFSDGALSDYNLVKKEYFFKVCRIEPENNIELILQTFSLLKTHKIVIVGNWNNSSFGRRMKETYRTFSNIILIEPIYDKTILNELRGNCKAYIHGHSAGGTNPSLVEAMGLRLPIIAYDVSFNRYTLNNEGTYFKNSEDLRNKIIQFYSRDNSLDVTKIHKVFLEKYSQEKISEDYAQLFFNSV